MTKRQPTPDGSVEVQRFAGLTYDDFRTLATNPRLSQFEKIGFPDAFREGHEPAIFSDIRKKLAILDTERAVVLDVGPGCSQLPHLLIEHCAAHHHKLVLMDSTEMLDQLPDKPHITKVAGRFPQHSNALRDPLPDGVDAIVVYSVLQHVFQDANPFLFLDSLLTLLRPGGELLLGDIPNVSKLNRFLSSDAGVVSHKEYMRTDQPPTVAFNRIEDGRITDAVVISLVERARSAGFDAYVLPQPAALPMSNRREDIYIRRP